MKGLIEQKKIFIRKKVLKSCKNLSQKKFSFFKCNSFLKNCSGNALGEEKTEVETRALAEMLERYSLMTDSKTLKESYTNLKNAVNPALFVNFSNKLLKGKRKEYILKLKKTKLNWTEGTHLNTKKKVLLPAQLIKLKYYKNEPLIRIPSSNGAAFGFTEQKATERAILELIERDCFMTFWLTKKKFKSVKENSIIQKLKKFEEKFFVIDISQHHSVKSIFVLIIDEENKGIKVFGGLKSDYSLNEAIKKAYYEAHKTKITLNNKKNTKTFWSKKSNLKKLDFIIKSPKKSIKENKTKNILKELLKKNIDIYTTDVTCQEIKKHGFVVKALIPSFHPFTINDKFPYDYSSKINPLKIKNKMPPPFF